MQLGGFACCSHAVHPHVDAFTSPPASASAKLRRQPVNLHHVRLPPMVYLYQTGKRGCPGVQVTGVISAWSSSFLRGGRLEASKRNSFTSSTSTTPSVPSWLRAQPWVPKVPATVARPPKPRRLISIIKYLIPDPSVSCHGRGELSRYFWISDLCSLQGRAQLQACSHWVSALSSAWIRCEHLSAHCQINAPVRAPAFSESLLSLLTCLQQRLLSGSQQIWSRIKPALSNWPHYNNLKRSEEGEGIYARLALWATWPQSFRSGPRAQKSHPPNHQGTAPASTSQPAVFGV